MLHFHRYCRPLLRISRLSTLLWLLAMGVAWGAPSERPADRTLFIQFDPTTRVLALDDTLFPLARQVLGRDADALTTPANPQEETQPPLLVIGTTQELNEWRQSNALPAPPQPLETAGDARFWMIPGKRIGLLSGSDATAITQLAASLRHYGQQSYVVQGQVVQGQGGETVQTGVWPAEKNPLNVAF